MSNLENQVVTKDSLVQELVGLDHEYDSIVSLLKTKALRAFYLRWKYGKILYENEDFIKTNWGSQKAFSQAVGKSEGVISNNKRGYVYLLDSGCETWDEVEELLAVKKLPATTYSFERIGTLLNDPERLANEKDKPDKVTKRIENVISELEELRRTVEPSKVPDTFENLDDAIDYAKELRDYVTSFDIYKSDWRSERFLNFVRHFGKDVITGEPCEVCDPHHTDYKGGSGSMGAKLPDYLTIPVARGTHMLIESGALELSETDILKAQVETLATFIRLNVK